MQHALRASVAGVIVFILGLFSQAQAGSFCTCEDRDNDGRFGVVLYSNGKDNVIRPNEGTYYDCRSQKNRISRCRQTGGFCACEDRDKDGRFGVARYEKAGAPVIKPNHGTYYDCRSFKSSLSQCNRKGNHCACEDRDNDGRFGVALYGQTSGRVIRPNKGTYYQCTSFKTSLGPCKKASNYCGCEDRDNDGRFGVVLYTGVNQKNSSVIRPNEGTYYKCASMKSGLAQCR